MFRKKLQGEEVNENGLFLCSTSEQTLYQSRSRLQRYSGLKGAQRGVHVGRTCDRFEKKEGFNLASTCNLIIGIVLFWHTVKMNEQQ